MGLLDKIRGLFANKDRNVKIAEIMNTQFRMPPDITELIEVWRDMYIGFDADPKSPRSSGIAALIANDLAKKACSELVVTALRGESEYNPRIFTDEMMLDIRQQVEYAIAMGGVVCRPYYDFGTNEIRYTWYSADRVLPTAWDGRKLIGCVLMDYYEKSKGNETIVYTKLESHGIDATDGLYHIRTKLFKNFSLAATGDYLGQEVPLTEVPDWADLTPDIVIENPQALTFAYMGTPFSNNKTLNVPIGVSVFKDAVHWVQEFDHAFESITWEDEAGRVRLFVNEDMIPMRRAQAMNSSDIIMMDDLDAIDKKLYKKLTSEKSDDIFEAWSPALRFDNYITYLNFLLHTICILSGLDPGQYVFNEKSEAVTAKEIISKQQKTYNTIVDIQKYMVTPLVNNLVDTVRQLQMLYGLEYIPTEVELNLDFGDSILVDEQQEKQDAMSEVNAGLRSKKNYLMVIRHLSEAEADEELALIDEDDKKSQPTYFTEGE